MHISTLKEKIHKALQLPLLQILEIILGFKISFSQTGEDMILSHLLSYKKQWFYIDIGANHPKKFNNTYRFYRLGWHGINIEPNPILWKKFAYRKNDINLNIGVSQKSAVMDFYVVSPDVLSTFDYSTCQKYIEMGHPLRQTIQIQTKRLEDVIYDYAGDREIDFLSCDTEWYDLEVLQSNNREKYRPHFVVLETIEYQKTHVFGQKNKELYNFMESVEYTVIAETHINTIFVDTFFYEKNLYRW